MVVVFLAAMLGINSGLTLILAVVLPVFALMTIVFRRDVTPTQQRARIFIARINAMLAEHINGMAVLQLFNRQERSAREFDEINRQHKLAAIGWITANAWFLPAVELMGTIAQAGLILVGASLLEGGELTVGILVAFLQYGARFLKPIQDVSERYGVLQTSIVSADRIFRLLNTPAPAPAVAQDEAPGGIDIEFDHVWFAYQGENWVLRDVSFQVPAARSVAVVGHTGAGKTTLMSLLLRFYEPRAARSGLAASISVGFRRPCCAVGSASSSKTLTWIRETFWTTFISACRAAAKRPAMPRPRASAWRNSPDLCRMACAPQSPSGA
jgi:ATP-binding cassette subfamily B multidrug efflux pump